jgi:hypothetical protein
LRQWARRWPRRRWAVENANGLGRDLTQRLLASNEAVIDVPAKLSTRVRLLTDANPRLHRPPVLDQVLDQLRPGDTLVVWKLDRLGRSLRHLVDTVTGLAERGIGFRSLQESIDTTTPGGKLIFHVFAALAEFERT